MSKNKGKKGVSEFMHGGAQPSEEYKVTGPAEKFISKQRILGGYQVHQQSKNNQRPKKNQRLG
jgi:hypothetical protein